MNCSNCGANLSGPYCSKCGQKNDSHPPTFGHFVGETAESFTHADSRLWQTLWLLLAKPGFLTTEFFAGRRARYLPPIRLYIVLSVTFFLLLAIIPGDSEDRQAAESVVVDVDCKELQYNGPFKAVVQGKLREGCARAVKDGGLGLANAFAKNIPKAMWFLLPVFAAVMLLFWWRPRRLYAEHLLFLIHNHSAVFATMTVVILIDLVLAESIAGFVLFPIPFYLLWYTFRGMRVYYGDSRKLALAKFTTLGIIYAILAAMVLSLTGFASLLSI